MEKMTPERAAEIIRGMIRDTYERGEKRGSLEMAINYIEGVETTRGKLEDIIRVYNGNGGDYVCGLEVALSMLDDNVGEEK